MGLDIREYGNHGMGFLAVNLVFVIFGILTCFGNAFGIVVGLIGIAVGIAGIFGCIQREVRVLFIWILACGVMMILALIEIFLLFALYVNYAAVPYVGALGLLLLPPLGIWLCWHLRGKSFSWSAVPSTSAAPTTNA